ncbi:hypothetical protein [Evansella tamaricis]|uniref:Uncharacterized protein n=1 Tax=Evansella tamaricis TaxID=2069301 RepID=A0ABS6JB36_9BACI|nr:hypothetical protein [Evansella tamaricis]MBU9710893.1 hypothetical protein [Evansella tamaricis]
MKIKYVNDTKQPINIHPATKTHGVLCDISPIKPLEERVFSLPDGVTPWIKLWEHDDSGLMLLVSYDK